MIDIGVSNCCNVPGRVAGGLRLWIKEAVGDEEETLADDVRDGFTVTQVMRGGAWHVGANVVAGNERLAPTELGMIIVPCTPRMSKP